jgi:hypothetical protein
MNTMQKHIAVKKQIVVKFNCYIGTVYKCNLYGSTIYAKIMLNLDTKSYIDLLKAFAYEKY